jgi:hypothetical protein
MTQNDASLTHLIQVNEEKSFDVFIGNNFKNGGFFAK